MTGVHKERLLKLSTFLREKVPDEHFDLRFIVGQRLEDNDVGYGKEAFAALPLVASGTQRGCGAVACAIGWCPAAFPDNWIWEDSDRHSVRLLDAQEGGDDDDFSYAEEFFGLDESESRLLFMPSSYPGYGESATRHDVAQRIEGFVASK